MNCRNSNGLYRLLRFIIIPENKKTKYKNHTFKREHRLNIETFNTRKNRVLFSNTSKVF